MLLTYISLRLTENRILLLLIPPRNHGGSRRYVWFYRKKSSKSPAKRANTAVRSTVKVVQLSTHNGNGTLKNKILLETIEKASVKSAPAKEKRRKSTTDKAPKKVTEIRIPDRRSAPAKSVVLKANNSCLPQSRNSLKKRTKEKYEENLCDYQLCRKVKQWCKGFSCY